VNQQLERLAFKNSVRRDRIYYCSNCAYAIPADVVARRRADGQTTVICPIRGEQYPLDDLAEQTAAGDDRLERIEREADSERERQVRLTTLQERQRTKQYHVFLCYNSKDKAIVARIASALMEQGVVPWFDEHVVLAGDRFPSSIERALDAVPVVAVLFGPQGLGRWQDMEYHAALQRSVEKRDATGQSALRLVPVLLPGLSQEPELPVFLRDLNHVDLRVGGVDNRDEMRKLISAILTIGNPPFGDAKSRA
jgi:hypothetical protein